MKKILFIFVTLLCLVGCGSEEAVTNVCQSSLGEEVTLVSVGNEIQTMTQTDSYTFEDLSVTADFMANKDNQEELLSNYKELYATVTTGLDISMELTETGVIFTTLVDFTQADFNELATLGIITDAEVKYIGLDQTISQMQLECTVQE